MSGKLETTIPVGDFNIKRRNIYIHSLKYTAIIVMAIVLGWGVGKINNKQYHDPEEASVSWNEIQVQKGGKPNTLLLSDGSKVFLNTATTFRYPTAFSTKNREVYLNGEAYFEIKKDSLKPFIVKLGHQNITVLGTSFNIEAYSEESYSIITLLSGSILLETFNDNKESISNLVIKTNQRVYYNKQTGIVALEKVDASLSNVWMKGEYKFKGEPLFLILKRLENYYGVTIHFEDDNLRNTKYTGTFKNDQNIMEVLRIINHEKQFTFSKLDDDNVIHINMSNQKRK
jgi:ferric-dicitrate binding protein FerR (iron transport regulator)